jgi:ADP-heptose:LPS heptosyltransferase
MAKSNETAMLHVYRKCNLPTTLNQPQPEKVCAVVKLGAHGDALWASSVFPGLKEQGFHTILYTQSTGETVLRHDPYINEIINFENRVPMAELGELFQWLQKRYTDVRILVEVVEGVSLPSPAKLQYHWPLAAREAIMNTNYLDMHHIVAGVPMFPKHMKFYPNDDEKAWANEIRSTLNPRVVVVVPNGSGCSKFWPYSKELVNKLCEHEDVSVVVLGDRRNLTLDAHDNLLFIGQDWDIRKAMTFCQLADVVVGQETGLLNCVGFEEEIHKVVLMSHSSKENLTRDWPNTDTIRTYPPCAGTTGCHLLHYDWSHCNMDVTSGAAKCQAMITVDMVLEKIEPYIISQQDTSELIYRTA